MAEERARVEATIHVSRRGELQSVTRLREETRGYANHESAEHRDHLEVAATQNADVMNQLQSANEKNAGSEQQLQDYTQRT